MASAKFYWYSLIMHMFLYRNVDYFKGTMNLKRKIDNKEIPVQLWSTDMFWDRQEASFLRFDNSFSSKLRKRLTVNPPRIPKELHDFVRPKERLPLVTIEHNWGDFISHPISTLIRIYGFAGQPHVLPFNVPLRLGFVEVMWQIGCIHDKELKGKGKGTIFPNYTIIPYFVILKGGYEHFDKFFAPYHLGATIA